MENSYLEKEKRCGLDGKKFKDRLRSVENC